MTPLRTLPLILALLLGTAAVHAQTGATLHLGLSGYGGATADAQPHAMHGPGGHAPAAALSIGAAVPMHLNGGRTRLRHELQYRHFDLHAGPPVEAAADGYLHSHTYDYRLTASHRVSERWAVEGSAAPTYRTALEASPGAFEWVWDGYGMARLTVGAHTSVGLGLGYSRVFGGEEVHPVLALTHAGERFEADVFLPERAAVWWNAVGPLSLGLTGRIDGDAFRTAGEAELRYANVAVGPSARLRAGQMAHVTAEAGGTLLRRMRLVEGGAETALDPAAAAYLRIGLQVGLR